MSNLIEADRALAHKLHKEWTFARDRNLVVGVAHPHHFASVAQTARRLVIAELAAKAVPDQNKLLDVMVAVHGPEAFISDPCEVMGDALDAIAPHLAALQARAERAEAERDAIAVENARIRQAIRAALENRYDSAYAALYSAHASARAALEITSPDTEG